MRYYNEDIKLKLNYKNPTANGNIAKKLTKEQQDAIGAYLKTYVEEDAGTRTGWLDQNMEGLKLAAQITETKNYPWPKASNIKYPLITVAAIQFNSRALPAVVNNNRPVKVGIQGKDDEQGSKQQRANRVAAHMSYQVLEEDEDWYEDTDRLLLAISIVGLMHRKRWQSSSLERPASRLINPQDMIINFDASSLKNCRRTEVLKMSSNEVHTLVQTGNILEIEKDPVRLDDKAEQDKIELTNQKPTDNDDDIPYTLYEVHWNLDLDGDGYREPYVCLVNALDGQLLSIVARWEAEGVKTNDKGIITRIEALNYYTDYMFIPNPVSRTHGLGFGHLLGPINQSVNTLINQLVDAGTLANLQGGFVGRGVKMKGGPLRFTPGLWKEVNATGAALKDNIVPLPIKEPSTVLFQLLGMLIQAGERISSVTEMMMGDNPGQNTAATTANQMVEQGMKVFTGIFSRIHRALGKEYKLLYKINSIWHNPEGTSVLLDDGTPAEVLAEDYNSQDLNVMVASDPNMVTDLQQMQKEQSLAELIPLGTINPQFVTKQRLRRLGYNAEEIQEATTVPAPEPDPKLLQLELERLKFEHEQQMDLLNLEIDQESRGMEALKDQVDAMKKMAEIDAMEGDQKLKELELFLKNAIEDRQGRVENILKLMQAKKANEEAKHAGDKANGANRSSGETGKTSK